ncbi:MAG: hypothetical protein U9M89_01425 [Patescibacteria group bacterium]|nr:hypothetical protein [Patescibacteria group bacterium]
MFDPDNRKIPYEKYQWWRTYDFGTSDLNDLAPGSILVKGKDSVKEIWDGYLSYGWVKNEYVDSLGVLTSGRKIWNKLTRDLNYNLGEATNTFRITNFSSGLYKTNGYTFLIGVGSNLYSGNTKIKIMNEGKQICPEYNIITGIGEWDYRQCKCVVVDGAVDFIFSSSDKTQWGINYIKVDHCMLPVGGGELGEPEDEGGDLITEKNQKTKNTGSSLVSFLGSFWKKVKSFFGG